MAKAKREKDELESECLAFEEEFEELKVRYEQYFVGVERKAPNRWREELKKKVLRLKTVFTRNAGLKFRVQTLHARFLSYERMWERSVREKEDGTYHRDVLKARMHRRGRDEEHEETAAKEKGAPTAAAGKGGAKAPAKPAAKAPAAPGAMSEVQMRTLYHAYVAAKMRCNEDVSRLTFDAVSKSVSKQIPDLMTRYKAKSVEFRVEVKDGKAVLKAIPKV